VMDTVGGEQVLYPGRPDLMIPSSHGRTSPTDLGSSPLPGLLVHLALPAGQADPAGPEHIHGQGLLLIPPALLATSATNRPLLT
jgi:hypothetical protein